VGAGRSEGLAREQSASEPCLAKRKNKVVDQNSVWKVEQVKSEGVISKCSNGRWADATNKLRASTVDVIRERAELDGPVEGQQDGVQFWKQSNVQKEENNKDTKGLAATERALGRQRLWKVNAKCDLSIFHLGTVANESYRQKSRLD
jgi:hypothetical protein